MAVLRYEHRTLPGRKASTAHGHSFILLARDPVASAVISFGQAQMFADVRKFMEALRHAKDVAGYNAVPHRSFYDEGNSRVRQGFVSGHHYIALDCFSNEASSGKHLKLGPTCIYCCDLAALADKILTRYPSIEREMPVLELQKRMAGPQTPTLRGISGKMGAVQETLELPG